MLYDDEDVNTSIPKLEKRINEDKERIQREKEEQISKKKTTPKAGTSRDNNRKMEASASKFKDFLNTDVDSKSNEKNDRNNNDDKNKTKTTPKPEKKASTTHKRLSSPLLSSDEPENKRRKTPEKAINYKPFNKLLEGVVLVISGIQVCLQM